ncbi:MAG: DNA-deoxyinosine glycosylase [Clostridia bacterium]|nr:DNA-deoxyinosine glycosylase [Clostridia bacterium]
MDHRQKIAKLQPGLQVNGKPEKRGGEYRHLARNFGPVYDADSTILILGSFPSARSREAAFYYGHPRNRFWPLLGRLLACEIPADTEGRKKLLLEKRIALWDTIEECDIIGSSDSSIRNVIPVDIARILNTADIREIYCNGNTSHALFMKYLYPVCGRVPVRLPSTSPANAAFTADRLYDEWKVISEVSAE